MAGARPSPIRAVIEGAREIPAPSAPEPEPEDGGYGGDDEPPAKDLPPGSPVIPLGTLGQTFFYLDALNQYVELAGEKHSRLALLALYKHKSDILYTAPYEPRMRQDAHTKAWEVIGWRPEAVQEMLMGAASARGIWDPNERLRQTGAWRDDDGALVIHAGDRVWRDGQGQEPGLIGRYVYPTAAAITAPAMETVKPAVAEELLGLLKSWAWKRGEIDAHLLLGWIGAALIGGALEWRPVAWITGGSGTGKSKLQQLLKRLLGTTLMQAADSTAAGISQQLGTSTRPVAIDELEPEEDGRKVKAVIELARLAASGGRKLRGGADHKSVEFVLRSCFLFSSILIVPLSTQDRNRMAILDLGPLRAGAAPELNEARLNRVGAQLLGRLARGWPRLAETLELYRASLEAEGHSARGCDVFGTLLACADLLLADVMPDSETAAEWATKLSAATLAETADAISDEVRCLQHILSTTLPRDAGGMQKRSAGEWAVIAAKNPAAFDERDRPKPDEDPVQAQQFLGRAGLKILFENGQPHGLAVANYHAELAKLFAGTHWAGKSGAQGVWVQAMARLPCSEGTGALYFGGSVSRAVLIPWMLIPQPEGDDARKPRGKSTLFNAAAEPEAPF